jgi:prefoldin subunit 5
MPPRGNSIIEENERNRRKIHFLKKDNEELRQVIKTLNVALKACFAETENLKQRLNNLQQQSTSSSSSNP